MSLLSGAVQPALVTLLSSTSQPSLSPIFTTHTDLALPSDSLITYLPDSNKIPQDTPRGSGIPKHATRGNISHPVVHIQSPTLNTTYIQAGCSLTKARRRREKGKGRAGPLGVELEWIGLQLKRLGRREMGFEIGIVDRRGREGVVRCSSFQKSPIVHPHRSPPLIHLPLSLPRPDPSLLTSWMHISLNVAALVPLFQSLPRLHIRSDEDEDDDVAGAPEPKKRRKIVELPNGKFGNFSYVRVYSNCRVRRIWFAAEGERTMEAMGKGVQEEWGLYAAEAAP